jgi:hypothetical protein
LTTFNAVSELKLNCNGGNALKTEFSGRMSMGLWPSPAACATGGASKGTIKASGASRNSPKNDFFISAPREGKKRMTPKMKRTTLLGLR